MNSAETPKTDNGTRVRLLFKTPRSIPVNITTDMMNNIIMPITRRGDLSSIILFTSRHIFLHILVFAVSFTRALYRYQFYP